MFKPNERFPKRVSVPLTPELTDRVEDLSALHRLSEADVIRRMLEAVPKGWSPFEIKRNKKVKP